MQRRQLLILGATGGTGRQLVAQALTAQHEVTAFVRDPTNLPPGPIRTVVGDIVRDATRLDDAMVGQDAVISALGVGQSFKPAGLIAQAAPRVVAAMQRAGVRRLIFTSAFGVGSTWPDTPLLPRLFIRTLLRQVYADKAAGEAAILQSALDWTMVHPAGLTNGPRTGRARVAEHLPLRGFPTVSRADVAAVALQLIDDEAAIRKSLLVAT
jgi:putative NADH-flavin reductase